MSMYFNSISDIERFIADQPFECEYFNDDYIGGVSFELRNYLHDRGFRYGDDAGPYLDDMSDEVFWGLFKLFEKK